MPRYRCKMCVVTQPAENRTRLAVSNISKVCRPIFQTVSWAQRNEAIISNLKVHWRRSISFLKTKTWGPLFPERGQKAYLGFTTQRQRCLSVCQSRVCFSAFWNASPSSSAPFICFPKVLCFRSSSSLIDAFSPKTRPGNPSKCEFVMHFDEFLV